MCDSVLCHVVMSAPERKFADCPNCMYKWKEVRKTKYDNVSLHDRPDVKALWQEHVNGCKKQLPEVRTSIFMAH